MGVPYQAANLGGGDRLTPAPNAEAASWLRSLDPDGAVVASLVPPVFEAYARVFHPAVRAQSVDATSRSDIRWSDIATSNDRIMHPLAQFPRVACVVDQDDLVPCEGQIWAEPPGIGTLPPHLAASLLGILGPLVRDSACWFAVWPGFSDVEAPANGLNAFSVPARHYALYTGQLSDAATSLSPYREQSPSMWWPYDRSWFVATDIDLVSTYVGGSASFIDAILVSHSLEALQAQPADRIDYGADEINCAHW